MPQYALEPSGAPKATLFLALNASMGTPASMIADPATNIFNAAASKGYHVLALAYSSADIIGVLCSGNDACFEATRRSVILGTHEGGSALDVSIQEGVVWRLEATLRALATARPNRGWDEFRVPGGADSSSRVAWGRVFSSGHSQGGGHAAFLGKLFPLKGVLQLSSTCDAVGATPASWTSSSGDWATAASTILGFAAPTLFDTGGIPVGGDTICPRHVAVWQNMGMPAGNMHDDAATCGATGSTHSASIQCTDNASRWLEIIP